MQNCCFFCQEFYFFRNSKKKKLRLSLFRTLHGKKVDEFLVSAQNKSGLEGTLSREIYLHFCDKEITSTALANHNIPKSLFYLDIRIILFFSYEPCFITVGDIFENIYAKELYDNWNLLFQSRDILAYMREGNLEHLIEKKRANYSHQRDKFPGYFDNSWREYEALGMYKSVISYNTSSDLERLFSKNIKKDAISRVANITGQSNGPEIEGEKILNDLVVSRNGKAITKDLFNKVLLERGYSKGYVYNYSLLLSMNYIDLKLKKHPATIATHLNLHMPFFDHLATTFPFHDIPVWLRLYKIAGVFNFIMKCNVAGILKVRSSPDFRIFIGNLRMLIHHLFSKSQNDYRRLLSSIDSEGSLFFPKARSEVKNLNDFFRRLNDVNCHFEALKQL